MLSYFRLATATLLTFVTLSFAQDVTLTIDGTSLNYGSTADIYGFQFDHDGCASGTSGGDAAANGFTVSCSPTTCLGFSFSGSSIPAGNGTLVDLGGECETLSGFVFAGEGGSSLDVELSDGGGDPVLPTVSILSPADGSSFDDATSVDVEVSCSDCGDGDHYHAFLDGAMQGMFYEDNFSIDVGYGDHTLTVTLADGGHAEYDHEDSSASVSFSVLETSAGGCDDPSACNDGDPDNECTYAEENYDCDGNCTADVDCAGECGGSAVDDECGVCNGDGIADGSCDCDGNVEDCAGECGGSAVEDECGECGGGGASVECDDGSTVCDASECPAETSTVDVLYNSDADIIWFPI